MSLPKAVVEAERIANEIMAAQQGGNTGTPAPAQVEQAPAPAPAAPSPAPTEEPSTAIKDHGQWEQRYRVIQGKYNAEVPRLSARVRELESEVSQLKTATPQSAAGADAVAGLLSGATPEEVERYGEDFVQFVQRLATSAAPRGKGDVSEFERRLAPIETVVAQTARDTFFKGLTDSVPKWESLNTDPGFMGWLADVDPFTGESRKNLFDDAVSRFDVRRTAAFFNAYSGSGQSFVGAGAQGVPTDVNAVPDSSRGHTPPLQNGGKVWGPNGIERFYDDVRRGKITPEDASRIEADIFAARNEGRYSLTA